MQGCFSTRRRTGDRETEENMGLTPTFKRFLQSINKLSLSRSLSVPPYVKVSTLSICFMWLKAAVQWWTQWWFIVGRGRRWGGDSGHWRQWIFQLRWRQEFPVLRAADCDVRRTVVPRHGAHATGNDKRRTQVGTTSNTVQQRRRKLLLGAEAAS